MMFFKKQGRRRIEKEYWAFDITSISSYSETLRQVKKGKNKEHDRLPQINLALLFDEQSGLPFYYRKFPGNITDVKTVKQLMAEFDVMGYKTREEYRMKDYDKYFTVTSTPKRGMKITPNEEAMREAARNYGYFALLSNEVNDPFEALSLYRSKDIVEKGFGNLKDRLNFRRMQVSSELSLNGKLFVEFVALIYLSYIKKKMQDTGLFENWTLQGLLDELDTIERFKSPEHGRLIGEVTQKQKDIFVKLGVESPSL